MKNSRNPGPALMRAPFVMRESKLGTPASGVHGRAQLAHRLREPYENGATHDGVADVKLFDLGNRRDRADVARRQPMARVHLEPEGRGVPRGVPHGAELRGIVRGVYVRPGVHLDGCRSQLVAAVHSREVRGDEKTGWNSGAAHAS